MLIVLSLLSLIILSATLLPLLRNSHWLVRGFDFPRFQLAVFAILLLVLQYLFLDFNDATAWLLSSIVFLCACYHSWWILPYTRLWPVEVLAAKDNQSERQLSFITANVLTPNRGADKLIKLVHEHQPDVLVTLESDLWWQEQLDVLKDKMPHTISCPLDNLYGMHVYSRLPLDDVEVSFLVEENVPSMHALLKLRTGDWVRVHFLHPAPPSPTENTESKERDAELIIVARSVADSEQATIVTGDLNDVAWSRTTRLFRKLSGLLDPRIGRGMYNTYHVGFPFMRWPLDHLFHSEHFTVQSIQRLPSIGSDHFSLLTRLSYAPRHGSAQNGLEATKEDEAFADDIENAKNVNKNKVPSPGS
ncbi:MAG: endonuclease/exonuclease/phosphatase (EEP) superfamily protein YafD [Glaciecola sp.]|jgi:endonuclease/exonuclease/phosphatase (EEP) superfamily protein YafD